MEEIGSKEVNFLVGSLYCIYCKGVRNLNTTSQVDSVKFDAKEGTP